jgi:glucose-1-phosphate thymidylyltransferase
LIIGVIPIGGQGTRLGLTFSKEMLPQKNFDYYNPISNHLVSKMLEAGAEKILFVHGFSMKTDVVNFYTNKNFIHIKQTKTGFANVLREAITSNFIRASDSIIFGMPDTIFEGNPFTDLVQEPAICCALFLTDDKSKVDRLKLDSNSFSIKSEKDTTLSDYFWGVLKFDAESLLLADSKNLFDEYTEVGQLLNYLGFTYKKFNKYIDLGTWPNYNRYLIHDYY